MLEFENTHSLQVNGTSLAIVETGEGEPIVFVHGGVSDLRTWSDQFPVLSKKFRAITYSRRFHAPNPPIPESEPDDIQQHVDDLAGLIQALDAEPAHIVGHSWGALIALILALQKPYLCRSLFLIEAPTVSLHLDMPPKIHALIKLFLTSPKLSFAIAKLGAGTFEPAEKAFRNGDDKSAIEVFGRGILGVEAYETLSPERYQQVWDNRGPDRAQALYHGFPSLKGAAFSGINMPVQLISGSDSPAVFNLLNDNLLGKLPNGQHRVIQNASHIVQEDAPKELNAALLEFLSGVS